MLKRREIRLYYMVDKTKGLGGSASAELQLPKPFADAKALGKEPSAKPFEKKLGGRTFNETAPMSTATEKKTFWLLDFLSGFEGAKKRWLESAHKEIRSDLRDEEFDINKFQRGVMLYNFNFRVDFESLIRQKLQTQRKIRVLDLGTASARFLRELKGAFKNSVEVHAYCIQEPHQTATKKLDKVFSGAIESCRKNGSYDLIVSYKGPLFFGHKELDTVSVVLDVLSATGEAFLIANESIEPTLKKIETLVKAKARKLTVTKIRTEENRPAFKLHIN